MPTPGATSAITNHNEASSELVPTPDPTEYLFLSPSFVYYQIHLERDWTESGDTPGTPSGMSPAPSSSSVVYRLSSFLATLLPTPAYISSQMALIGY